LLTGNPPGGGRGVKVELGTWNTRGGGGGKDEFGTILGGNPGGGSGIPVRGDGDKGFGGNGGRSRP